MESDLGRKESYKINKTRVLKKLGDSMIEQTGNEGFKTNVDIEKLLNDVMHLDYAAKLNNRMDKMINTKKNENLAIARRQGVIFKTFESNYEFIMFLSAIKKFNISKTTINFKIEIVEFINMSPRMEKSGISLYYLKNNFKIIKEVCKKNASEFK